jgi:Uma2 family endonuclease
LPVAVTAPTTHRFTAEDWDRLVRLGFFHKEDRVELLDGEIVDMGLIGDPHEACVDRFTRLFSRRTGDDVIVRVKSGVRLSQFSVPQLDVALLKFVDDFYASGKPRPADILLLVEVADSSLRYDLHRKAPLNAQGGVPECWVVDLSSTVVHVLTDPGPDGYRRSTVATVGDQLVTQQLPALALDVAEVFGRVAQG